MNSCLKRAGWITVIAAWIAAPSFAQDSLKKDDKSAGADESQMMAVMMKMAQPGENHKLLENFVGSWTYKVKWWTSPDGPPGESSGTASTKPVMEGRYFISEVSGKMSMPGPDGKPVEMEFKGRGTDGYDNARQKFVSSWIDNMGTGILMLEGTYDAATKTFTYTAEEEPMPGIKTTMREVLKVTDHDHYTVDFYEQRGGAEVRTMELAYTRS